MTHMRAGHGEHQVNQHAPVERKLTDRLRLDDFANTGILGAQDFNRGVYFHRFVHRAQLEPNRDGQLLSDFETQRFLGRGKPLGLHAKLVVSRKKSRNLEKPLLVCDYVPNRTRIRGFKLDGGPADGALLRITDTATEYRVVALSQVREPKRQEKQQK